MQRSMPSRACRHGMLCCRTCLRLHDGHVTMCRMSRSHALPMTELSILDHRAASLRVTVIGLPMYRPYLQAEAATQLQGMPVQQLPARMGGSRGAATRAQPGEACRAVGSHVAPQDDGRIGQLRCSGTATSAMQGAGLAIRPRSPWPQLPLILASERACASSLNDSPVGQDSKGRQTRVMHGVQRRPTP